MRKHTYQINEKDNDKRILNFLKSELGYSTRIITKLKHYENGILLNGTKARTIDTIKTGDVLEINIPEIENTIEPIEFPLKIEYEDDDIIVINKSPYLAMHPSHNHQGDTLANALAYHLQEEGKNCIFRAVGRLDKGTSGLVVCALNSYAASKLNGKITKEYYAVVKGIPEDEGTVSIPIYRPDPMKTLRACSHELGNEEAITHWKIIEKRKDRSLIKLNLETGRTHQIRVHMSSIGHPLAGDEMYGDFELEYKHQLLHCGKCNFIHPVTNENIEIMSNIPDEFYYCLNK